MFTDVGRVQRVRPEPAMMSGRREWLAAPSITRRRLAGHMDRDGGVAFRCHRLNGHALETLVSEIATADIGDFQPVRPIIA